MLEQHELHRQVSELADREAIRQLPILYCHYVRTRNIDAVVKLYADGGVFELQRDGEAPDVYTGCGEIEQSFRNSLDAMDPWPFTHNHVVHLSDNGRATGVVYAEIRLGMRNHRLIYLAVYYDEYVKERGDWKFGSRKLALTTVGE